MRQEWIQKIFGTKAVFSTELLAGVTTFLTMAYIIFVNAEILANTGMDKTALIVITCLVSGLATIVTGIVSNTPIAMAPGMGLNAFFAFTLVIQQKIPWPVALGIVFISGLIFLILTLVGLRQRLVEAIPRDLLHAIAVGIGIFIAFIGLQNAGIIIRSEATMVAAGTLNEITLISLAGLAVMVILELSHFRGSLLMGIIFATFLSVLFGHTRPPDHLFSLNFSIGAVFGRLDILGALRVGFLAPIFTLMFMDLFDSIGSLLGLAQEAEMTDKNGKVRKLDMLLNLDAGATMFGAVMGTSTTTTYIESASGIASGGRTGLTSIFTGLLFLLSIPLIPVLTIVPGHATAPALIMVGFLMMKNFTKIDFRNVDTGFPSFLIIVLIALSYSISNGLAFGFLSFSLLRIFRGKFREIKPALWVINILCLLYFIV